MPQDTQEVLFSFEANSSIMWSLILLSGSIRWWLFLIKVQYSWEFLFPTNWLSNTLLLRFENNLFLWQDEKFTKLTRKSIVYFTLVFLFCFRSYCSVFASKNLLVTWKTFWAFLQISRSLNVAKSYYYQAAQQIEKDVLINFKKLDFLAMMTRTL